MAIQFLNQQNPNKYAGLEQGLGSLLGGLGGVGMGYAADKLGFGGDGEEEKRFVDSGIMTSQQYQIYKKLKTPQERNAFMTQTMKQNERMRQGALEAEEFNRMKGGVGTGSGIGALDNLGAPEQPMQPPQQMQRPGQDPFSSIESAQRLLAGGVDPNRVKLITDLNTQQQKMDIQREELKAKKEAPHRVQVAKQVAEYQKKVETADRLIADYKAMSALADHPELRTGAWQQFMTQAGIPEALQSDASFVADKLIGDITLASASKITTPGKMTGQLLKQVAKINPSRLSSPEGMKQTLALKEMSEEIEKILGEKVNEIIDESPDGIPPLNVIQRAQKEAKPEIEKIHEKQLKFAEKMVSDAKASMKTFKVGSMHKGQPDPSGPVNKYRDPNTGLIMVRNAERTGYIPEGR